jgi:hypothetical protein
LLCEAKTPSFALSKIRLCKRQNIDELFEYLISKFPDIASPFLIDYVPIKYTPKALSNSPVISSLKLRRIIINKVKSSKSDKKRKRKSQKSESQLANLSDIFDHAPIKNIAFKSYKFNETVCRPIPARKIEKCSSKSVLQPDSTHRLFYGVGRKSLAVIQLYKTPEMILANY